MPEMDFDRGVVRIKNVSGEDYTVEEVGGLVLPDQEVFNILDPAVPNTYTDFEAAFRLVAELTTAKLYQDIQAGKVALLETTSPLGV